MHWHMQCATFRKCLPAHKLGHSQSACRERKRGQGASLGTKLPTVTPNAKCKLRLLKMERIKDWLLLEEEFVANQQRLKPHEERAEEDRTKVRWLQQLAILPGRADSSWLGCRWTRCEARP